MTSDDVRMTSLGSRCGQAAVAFTRLPLGHTEPRPLQTHRLHRAQRTRITYQNSEVTDSITSALRTFIGEHYTRSYMLGRKDIWGTNLDSLEMRKLTCHRRHQQLRQRVFTTKFMFGLLATEAEMHKRDPDRCGKCSLCSLDDPTSYQP